jgi:hypothetical protein
MSCNWVKMLRNVKNSFHLDRGIHPRQDGAWRARDLPRSDSHHYEPAGRAPERAHVQSDRGPRIRESWAAALQDDFASGEYLLGGRAGEAQRKIEDSDGIQSPELFSARIPGRKGDLQLP